MHHTRPRGLRELRAHLTGRRDAASSTAGPARLGWRARLREDIDVAIAKDPAIRSRSEVVLGYPGLHAIWAYRLHNALWRKEHRLAARLISQWARAVTGIEIHPGATIGRRFFIDHGMGVVIGETAEIGEDVMLYHDVTLGGRSLAKVKRHPTLCDGVTVGAGARILGPVVVGARAQVGANAVVVRDVPAGAVVVGVPGVVRERGGGVPAEQPTPQVGPSPSPGPSTSPGPEPGPGPPDDDLVDPAIWI